MMKNKKLIYAGLAVVFLIILCCIGAGVIFLIVGNRLSKENDVAELQNLLEEIEENANNDATDSSGTRGNDDDIETTDAQDTQDANIPGDAGENDPNAGDGTVLVTMDDGTQYQIYSPQPNEKVDNPIVITVTGQISGSWYFEGSFQVELRDYGGNVIGTGLALAQSDWMTSDLVEYSGVIIVTEPTEETYLELFLLKENPSGLPENANQINYPIRIK